jgi:molybdopterin-guanine dinucleotide biosynthesis protein A
MGQPKQLLEIGEMTMIERVVRALAPEVEEVVLIGAGPLPVPLRGLGRIADTAGVRGPMAGILGALRARRDACGVVAACDQPRLDRAAVRWLIDSRRTGARVIMASIDGFVEPLPAAFEPEATGLLEDAAAAGAHALHRLASNPLVAVVDAPAHLRSCWFNANTPQELIALEAG